MSSIFYALAISLLLINLAGAAVLTRRLSPYPVIALNAGIVGGVLLLFFVEHFVGLGKLAWLWPLTTAASVYAIYRYRDWLLQHQSDWLVFGAAFAYALAWRWLFPDIVTKAENIPNLYFIQNYMPGATLPPPDNWLPPQLFNFYYAFQHYGAALIGRLFGLDAGTTYNLAVCLLYALLASCAWFVVSSLTEKKWHALLVVAALTVGGSGLSPFYHLLFQADKAKPGLHGTAEHAIWASTRFVGLYDKEANTPLAAALLPKSATPVPELPLETIAFDNHLGSYHPPTGGFFLMLLALACMVALEKPTAEKNTGRITAQALLGVSIPVSIITNAWIFPLQLLLVGGWALLRRTTRQPLDGKILLLGAAAGFVLIMPFMAGFAGQSISPVFRLIEPQDRAPAINVAILLWPMFALAALAVWQARSRPMVLLLILIIAVVFAVTQMVYADDGTNGGAYKRFNTALKWWSWIYFISIAGLGAHNLGSPLRAIRYGTVAVLLLVCVHAFDQARYVWSTPKTSAGKLHGHQWLSADPNVSDMLNYLRAAPPGIVLESMPQSGYSASAALTLFANKTSLLGWPYQIATWKKPATQVAKLHGEVQEFYTGRKSDSLEWLKANHVSYIVWNQSESQNAAAFDLIQKQIDSLYQWKPFYENGTVRMGLWIVK
jgi:Uncharacterized membrane protein (DUF2298)